MVSTPRRKYYCRCGTRLAADNTGRQCALCLRQSREKFMAPPEVAPQFWDTEQFAEAFAARHMGRVSRVYRSHPDHFAVYGPYGISQTLLGQWLGLRQPQVSRFETGPPLQLLDTLQHWARVLCIPAHLLWFRLPEDTTPLEPADPPGHGSAPTGRALTGREQTAGGATTEHPDDTERDPVLTAPWNHRGTVEVAVLLSSRGGRVKRRGFLSLAGPALTAPAHQWLVHEPEPLISGLNGQRVSGDLVARLRATSAELRQMDDVAGGGSVLAMAQHLFGWVTELLDHATYSEHTGRALHTTLAELGQLCGWSAFDMGDQALAQRYYIAGLRAAHSADDRPFGAHILASMAEQASAQGQAANAVTFIETALAGARSQATPSLLTRLYLRKARALAAMRDVSACNVAISQARTHVERLTPDDEPPYLYWLSPTTVTAEAGMCMLDLEQPDQSVGMLDDSIAEFRNSFVRDTQILMTFLADARTRPGKQQDLDAAAELGRESLDLAESLNSPRGTALLRDLSARMKPHHTIPAVREFLDRVETVGS